MNEQEFRSGVMAEETSEICIFIMQGEKTLGDVKLTPGLAHHFLDGGSVRLTVGGLTPTGITKAMASKLGKGEEPYGF